MGNQLISSEDIILGVDGGGLTASLVARPPRLFKIISGSNPYAATPIYLYEIDGTTPDEDTRNITAANKLLWEVNGHTKVPADTVVEATPNPFGTGWHFWYPTLPPYRRPVNFCVIKSGSNVTDIKVTWQEVDGSQTCETVSTCTGDGGTGCNAMWWCIDGVATSVATGSAPPAGTIVLGPFHTEALAEEVCPDGGAPVDTLCCAEVPRTLYLTLSAGGTVTMTYDGSQYWTGNKALTGCTVYFRWDETDCGMEYSRDNATWYVASCAAGEDGCFTCTPTFVSTNYTFDSSVIGSPCSFGSITGVLSA